jgi:hypothetical protein
MSILSFIYQKCLLSPDNRRVLPKLRAKIFRLIRRLILCFGDPPCRMEIWQRRFWMPFSHERPLNLRGPGYYDQLIGRIARFIRLRQSRICGIDVGANIGDTIAACDARNEDQFLAIEPNPVFFKYLNRNLKGFSNVRLLKVGCAASDSSPKGGSGMPTNRVDTLVEQFPEFRDCNFLKIDTDGYDFEVLRGARALIARAQPVVLFECQMWNNAKYVEDIFEIFRLFAESGYSHALVYDNLGYLYGPLDLKNPLGMSQALFYELSSARCYFDVLVMQDVSAFLRREFEFYLDGIHDLHWRTAAEQAARMVAANGGLGEVKFDVRNLDQGS